MPTTYKEDIQPLFREGDIACMQRHSVLLDDPTWMCDAAPRHGYDDHGNARVVQERLAAGDMPPDLPWSPDRLAAYQKWMDDGFQP
jgi:hypothetical protein